MVTCWSENSDLRPNSSQLVGICSAPEFTHLLDVALIQHDDDDLSKNADTSFKSVVGLYFQGTFYYLLIIIYHYFLDIYDNDNNDTGTQCWITSLQKSDENNKSSKKSKGFITILTCSQFGWIDKKVFIILILNEILF